MRERIKLHGERSFLEGVRFGARILLALATLSGLGFYVLNSEGVTNCEVLVISLWCWCVFLMLAKNR